MAALPTVGAIAAGIRYLERRFQEEREEKKTIWGAFQKLERRLNEMEKEYERLLTEHKILVGHHGDPMRWFTRKRPDDDNMEGENE